jgi:hypothetical protein
MSVGIKFNAMQNIITNTEFKPARRIAENRDRSVVLQSGMITFLNMGTRAAFFHKARKDCLFSLNLNMCLRTGIIVTEQGFETKPRMPASPRDLEGFSLLMALQISRRIIITLNINNNGNNNNNNFNSSLAQRPMFIYLQAKG